MSFSDKDKDITASTVAPVDVLDGSVEVLNGGSAVSTNDPHRGLRMRHVQLIAISGSIGAALFVSIGSPLTKAGPLGLLIGVSIWAFVVWTASNCLIEMTTLLPLDGGFITFAGRFVDNSFGMALGWNYLITQWALICFEFSAMNVIISYWTLTLSPAVAISVGIVLLGALNLWSVRWFGEAEFWISITKVFLILGLTLYTFITMVGGNPLRDVYGFRYWKTPGPFAGITSFKSVITGIFDSVSWATFAIVGPDYISLIGGEVQNPRRILPRAFKSTMWRMIFFYVVGAFCVGIVASSNDPNLLGAIAAGAPGAARSPYVISMNRLGIPVLPSLVNALILISIFSTTNSFVFAASRSLLGLAQQGRAPKVFTRLNRQGVPYLCVLITLLMACLSYLALSQGTVKVLNWWINLVTCAQLVSWSCIAVTFLRFYYATKRQNVRDSLPQRGWWQPFSGYLLLVVAPIVLLFSGYYVFLPGSFTAPDFVFAYGSVFIFLAILLGSKVYQVLYKKQPARVFIPLDEVDLVTDVDQIEALTEAAEVERANRPKTKGQKVSDFFF